MAIINLGRNIPTMEPAKQRAQLRIEANLTATQLEWLHNLVEGAGGTVLDEVTTSLPTDQDRVYAFIKDAGHEVAAPEIAAQLGINPDSVRVYCSRLAAQGRITRRREPIDRRYTRSLYSVQSKAAA